jgi:glucan 1,3-beta-glucosidase
VPANCAAQEVDIDYNGADIKTIKDVSPSECCDTCLALAECTAYTFINYNTDGRSACYLKSGTGTKTALKGAVSAIVTGTKPACSTKVGEMCGDASGTVCCPSGAYCQPWNQWYYQCIATPAQCSTQKPDVDFYGHDLAVKYGLRPDQCCDECAATGGCVAYSFVNDNPGQTACYLKSSTAGETCKVGCVSGIIDARAKRKP